MGRDIVVTPRSWSPRGEAELAVMGRPMKVWNGIVGEHARVRIVQEGDHSDYAVFKDTGHPSPHRVEPRCARFHTCGGCPWMHMDAAGQARARRQVVLDALGLEGLEDVHVGELAPSPDGDEGYRHVTKLGIGWSDLGRLRVGAWGRHTRTIVPIPDCPVVAPVLRKVMASVAHHVIDLRLEPYNPIDDLGVLRAPVLRASRATGEVIVTIVAARRTRGLTDLATALVTQNAEVVGVALHVNDTTGNNLFIRENDGSIETRVLEGRGWIEEKLNDVVYRVGPGDFFQTNPGMAEVLYQRTLQRLELEPNVPFVDLYCGVGGLALAGAKTSGWAIGVEEVQGAVDAAREAAKRNGVQAEFVAGRVEEALPALARRLAGTSPVVTVNPARRGLEPGVVDAIAALRPRRLAYISCNPRALARDLAAFKAHGMQVGPIELYDMFPHTAHVEAVAILGSEGPTPPARRAPRRKMVGSSEGSAA